MKKMINVVLGLVGLILIGSGCLPDESTGPQGIVNAWDIPCSSGQDLNYDGNIEYYPLDLSAAISVSFQTAIDPNSFTMSTGVSSNPSVSFTSAFSTSMNTNDTLTLTPASPYSAGQVYQVTLLANSVSPADANSGYAMVNDSSISFQAVDKSTDTTFPYIVSMDPPNNATAVPLDKVMTVKFSKPLLSLRIYTASGAPSIDGVTVTTTDDVTYTFTAASGLQSATTYQIVIDPSNSGCTVGTMDALGHGLVPNNGSTQPSALQWSFTTQ